MKTIYMALDNHKDHELLDLLTDNLPWIIKNFSILMIESVPVGYQNDDALGYFFSKIKDYTFPIDVNSIFNEEELFFLKTPFTGVLLHEAANAQSNPNLEPMAFVQRRIELLSRIMYSNSSKVEPSSIEGLKHPLGIFKRYRLFSQCLKEGIQLKGMEPASYQAGLGI